MSGFNILDFIVIGGVIAATYYFFFRKKAEPSIKKLFSSQSAENSQQNQSFIERMKSGNRSMVIFYGSQTGTAEEFAIRLACESKRYALKALTADPEECEMEDLSRLREIENSMVVFIMATYGEGDPTDNCADFMEWLQEGNAILNGIRFAIFGLGNKTYEHYNKVGKYVDERLQELGATKVLEIGLGDDDANIEEDFISWKENFWPTVCEYFGLYEMSEDVSSRQYSLTIHEGLPIEKLFTGEPAKLASFKTQKPPHDAKSPFLSRVTLKRELHKAGQRSCMHLDLDLTGSRLRYQAGDHVGVMCHNSPSLVAWVAERLGGVDLDTQITLTNTDEEATKKHPFPCPTTYRTALTWYLDLTSCPRTNVLKDLSEYATDEKDKDFLLSMTKVSKDAKELYLDWIVAKHRTTLHVLQHLPSLHPPVDHFIEMLPKLQARYYSISSSSKLHPTKLSITAVLVDYTTPTQQHMRGVATGLMSLMNPWSPNGSEGGGDVLPCQLPIFIRKSQFRLPSRPNIPVLMIGPGTGVAPFMAFLQERKVMKDEGKPLGDAYLFFGCRNKKEDFIYEDELNEYEKEGVLTKLYVAFSRDQEQKEYVQHIMLQSAEEIWKVLSHKGHLYVCGDAKNMSQDVDKALHSIATTQGSLNTAACNDFFKKLRSSGRYSCDVWS